jgi:hypothetical protein
VAAPQKKQLFSTINDIFDRFYYSILNKQSKACEQSNLAFTLIETIFLPRY